MRDPKTEPKPGDEFKCKVVKCKVIGVEIDETGIHHVDILGGHVDLPYMPAHPAKFTISRFRAFVGHDTVEVIPVQESL